MTKRMICLPYENSLEQRDRGEFVFRNQRKPMKEDERECVRVYVWGGIGMLHIILMRYDEEYKEKIQLSSIVLI